MSHTPGPWYRDAQMVYERDSFGRDWPIAQVNDRNHGSEESAANAALIASAPTLAAEVERLREVNAEMRLALIHLSNEVLGSLPLMEELARQEFGNTNYTCLIQRAEQAQAIVALAKGKA